MSSFTPSPNGWQAQIREAQAREAQRQAVAAVQHAATQIALIFERLTANVVTQRQAQEALAALRADVGPATYSAGLVLASLSRCPRA